MKLVKSIDEYKKIEKKKYADITVIRNENISEAKINEYRKNHIRNTERIIVNYIVFISKGIDFLQCSLEKVYSGYEYGYISNYTSKQLSGKIIVVGLFCDFSAAMDRRIKLLCKEPASISYIIAEDIASLSYQLMKQGYRSDSKKNLVVFGNLLSTSEIRFAKKLEQYGFDVITQIDYTKKDISKIIQDRYKTILFFSHGKDDHINIGEFTICGKHHNLYDCSLGPACHYTGRCFKSDDKLIRASNLKAENVIFASCHSGVFSDEANYGPTYNLMLSAIYSDARSITFTVSGSRFDYKEICALLFENGINNPADTLNGSLMDIMNVAVFRTIGSLSGNLFDERDYTDFYAYNESNIKNILETCREFIEYDFLPENEEFVHKVFKFYRNGMKAFNRTQIYLPDIESKERIFCQKIHELDKELAEYISQNYYAVCDMPSYVLNNMNVDRDFQADYLLANEPNICHFKYNDLHYNNIKEVFSYKAADEIFSFGECNVHINDFFFDQHTRKIQFSASVNAMSNTKCFYGIGFPGYMKNYILSERTYYEMDMDEGVGYSIEMTLALKEDAPRQAHYCGFYFVQNMKIYHHKLVFNI